MSDYKSGATIPHSKIFDYWKDKCIDKYGNVYPNTSEYFDNTIEVVYDWGEPECWCCRKTIPIEKEEKYLEWINDNDNDRGLRRIWDCKTSRSRLNKAHIIPKCCGGKDTPDNMFLICESCHKLSPDLTDKKMFLSYVYDKRMQSRNSSPLPQLEYYLEALDILHNIHNLYYPDFGEPIIKTHIGAHGGGHSDSTFVYYLVSIALKNKTKLRNDLEEMFYRFINTKIKELETNIALINNDNNKKEYSNKIDIYKEVINFYEKLKVIEQGG